LQILALLPVFSLWALPSIGWYLMVSAWAKSRVFPWAIGIPLLSIGVLLLINHVFHFGWDIRWYSIHIVLRLIAGVFPASWLLEQQNIGQAEHYFSLQNISEEAWFAIQGTSIWIGAIAGIVMLFVAMRLRQFNESNT
jgi:ABC-2 type transport system permease protein